MKAGSRVLLGVFLLAARFCGAGSPSNGLAKLDPLAPFPAVQSAARAAGIPVEGIDSPARADTLGPDDSVTGLVTLHEKKGRLTQWLIYFQATNDVKESVAKKSGSMVLYTSTGHKFEFDRSSASIRVRTLGPFVPSISKRGPPAFNDKSAVVSVNQDFLSLGFDRGAAAMIRWGEAGRQNNQTNFMDSFSFSPTPFDHPKIDHARTIAAQLGVTTEEERSVVGWIPALSSYFSTVAQTPNLKGIMLKVLNLPSIWSFVRRRGVTAFIGISHDDVKTFCAAGWGLPSDSAVYALPGILSLNDHEALALTMIVTAPRPPLLVCGGIVGLLAENPDDAENYLTMRIISARGNSASPEKN